MDDLTKILFLKTYWMSFRLIFCHWFFHTKKHQKETQNYPNNFAWHFSLDYMITCNGIYCKKLYAFRLFAKASNIKCYWYPFLLRHICRYILHSIRLLIKKQYKVYWNRKRIQLYYVWDFISHSSSLTIAYFFI